MTYKAGDTISETQETPTIAENATVESKSDKFKRLAEYRVNKIVKFVDSLANLSNKAVYDFSEDEIETMFDAIYQRVAESKAKFNSSVVEKPPFKFTAFVA